MLHSEAINDFMAESDVKTIDINTTKALAMGEVGTFMGFMFHRSERLLKNGANDRCFAWHKSGIKLAVGMETTGRISELPGKRYSTQVFYST